MIKFIKHISRIVLSIPLCILSIIYLDLNEFLQILLFAAIYVLISLLIEPVFQNWQKSNKKKQNNK